MARRHLIFSLLSADGKGSQGTQLPPLQKIFTPLTRRVKQAVSSREPKSLLGESALARAQRAFSSGPSGSWRITASRMPKGWEILEDGVSSSRVYRGWGP